MSTTHVPPQNIEAEESVLGAMLVAEPTLTIVISEIGLTAEDFYLEKHGTIFACIHDLVVAGGVVDELTVNDSLTRRGELEAAGGKHYVSELAAKVPAAGNAKHYAEIVQQNSNWRRRLAAGQKIQQAVHEFDNDAFEAAVAKLGERVGRESDFYDADRQRDLLYELMEGRRPAEFYWPFDKLNRIQGGGPPGSAGMRRGNFIVLSGYQNDGKSILGGQLMDINHKARGPEKKRARVCLYDNEMEPDEIVARRAWRLANVPYGSLMNGDLDPDQAKKNLAHINSDLHWPIVSTKGWTVQEVCLHIRQYRWDFVVIDILHNFPFEDERGIAAAVGEIKATAGIANCCIVLVAHVNRGGNNQQTGRRRRPVCSDLRWSGEIENQADVVAFVYREQDMEDQKTDDGYVYFDKGRGCDLSAASVGAHLNKKRGRWEAHSDQAIDPAPERPVVDVFGARAA